MYDGWSRRGSAAAVDDMFSSEDEIRMKSHEIIENEDMQNLLRVFSMEGSGTAAGSSLPDDAFYSSFYSTPLPNYSFGEERERPSGKAVVGWLKIKAAMRWGIFVRKKAAEKRAQLVELED